MLSAVADTHTVIWYIYNDPRLSTTARTFIEAAAAAGDEIGVATISFVEMTYLIEKGRIAAEVYRRVSVALDQPGAVLRDLALTRQVATALALVDRSQVPDMPDRIIAATAVAAGVPVISRDGKIRLSSVPTIW